MNIKRQYTLTITTIFIAISILSCVSRNIKLDSTDAFVDQGNYSQAYDELQESKSSIYNTNLDKVVYLLDSGMIALHSTKTDTAIQELSDADLQMDELRKVNIGEQIAASTINDNLITYSGSNYEYVFTSIMLSLGYLIENKFDSGFVEIRRTQDKLKKIQVDNDILVSEYSKKDNSYIPIEEIKVPFVDSAFARLMSFWLYRADFDFSNLEVAARKYDEAIIAQPALYPFEPPKIEEAQFSTEGTRVQIVSLTDRAPILYAKNFSLNAVEGGVVFVAYSEADSLDSRVTPVADDNFLEGAGVIPIPGMDSSGLSIVFSVPAMATYQKKVEEIEVWNNDELLGSLTLTEDLETMAIETFNEDKKIIYARQVSRVVTKTLMGAVANEIDPLLGLVTQIANNVSEGADTRIARYFPARIWTGDFVLSGPGEYALTIKYLNNGNIIKEVQKSTTITKENDTFNLVFDSFL